MPQFVPHKQEKEVISLRIPAELLHEVDVQANRTGISRNELINQMIVYALSNMSPSEKSTTGQ